MPSNREIFLRHVAQTSPAPMMLEAARAEGVFIYDPNGKRYYDFISGISVSNIGHGNTSVIEAIKNQAETYLHTMVYGEFVLTPQLKYAQLLAHQLGNGLESVFFVNSGSEAVEGGLKVAKKFTRREGIVAFNHAYHGSTHGALSVTGTPWLKEGFGPMLPKVTFLDFNHSDQLDQITEDTACVLVEPVQGEAGAVTPENGFLAAVRQRCNETGTLLIFDECQMGFGRAGEMFAFKKYKVVPDIILLGKALGGGMPLGAFITRPEIMNVLTHDPVLGHITTFGGHAVCCAAGLASLEFILKEKLIDQIPPKEQYIKTCMKHPAIQKVMGTGMFFAVHLPDDDFVQEVIQVCMENGLIIDWFLNAANALRFAPPLIISMDQLKEACEIILEAIASIYQTRNHA